MNTSPGLHSQPPKALTNVILEDAFVLQSKIRGGKGIRLTWCLVIFPPRRFLFKNLHMFPFIGLLAKKGV